MDCLVSIILFSAKYLELFLQFVLYLILLPFTPLIKPVFNIIARKFDIHQTGGGSSSSIIKRRPWELQILNWKFYAYAISHGSIGVMEAWFKGWWDVEDFEGIISKITAHPKYMFPLLSLDAGLFHNIRWNLFNIQTKERAKIYCKTSYNLGSNFFQAFLDPCTNLYSMAYYGLGATTLEQAQLDKMALTAANLKLKPGMRVLDLGCGFGGFSHHLAKEHGVSVLSLTNSSDMATATRERCLGLDVTVVEADWRDLSHEIASFDRVVGIEVLFHVGRHNVDPFFRQIAKWLKPNGICIIQDFATRPGMAHNFPSTVKYFFPGCYVYDLPQILGVSEKYFCLEGYKDLTPDMERTCAEWLRRFVKNWPQIENKYDEKYYKMYKSLFSAGVEMARLGMFGANQFVFRKLPAQF